MAFPINFSDPDEMAEWSLYQEDISADYVTDTGFLIQGGGVLEIVANRGGKPYSNHCIAQKRLNDTGTPGTFVYKVKVKIVADPADNLTFPQTGPEISVQNTREVAGPNFLTNTMGVQYVANPWSPPHWNAWKEVSPGVGQWVQMTDECVLNPNTWYTLELTADMEAKIYTGFTVTDETGLVVYDFDAFINGQPIASEDKWEEAALWITCEAENLFLSDHSVSTPTRGHVLYDDVDLTITPPEEP